MKRAFLFLVKAALIISVLGILVVCLVPIKSNAVARIALLPFEERFRKSIEFNASKIWLPANIFLEGVSIIDESGRLYYFDTIDIRYNLEDLILKREFLVNLKDVKLYQNIELLDSVADMLVISKLPDVEFREIKGILQLSKDTVFIKGIYAYNDRMRIRGGGWINNDGTLDCDINLSFSEDITDKIPDAVKIALLRREDGGWMGIALKGRGNYKKPTLHISSDSIRLNVREGALGDE